ncbi:MAG: 2-dehydropantoate 2-reductase [Chloroflexi bacterium]|nr:2-dehydropantoate 2-reductase [Chloroflexota bacterium]
MRRVAVIGAGAVGCYYGARLAQAGHEVHFLMRSDHEVVASHGLTVNSKDGDFRLDAPHVHRDSATIGQADWIICALKATAIADARPLVEPCIGEETRILLLMNGLGLEETVGGWFGEERIFGGLAFTCINRSAPGVIDHIDYGTITLGHQQDSPAEVETALRLWDDAQVEVLTAPSLLLARWRKLLWNIPFNGLAVAGGGITTDRIMGDPGLRANAEALMTEVLAVGNADLAAHGQATRLDPDEEIPAMLRATEAMAVYKPSTMIDFVAGRPLEVDAIFGEPLRRAEALGVPAPRLTLLTALMRTLDPARRPPTEPAGD